MRKLPSPLIRSAAIVGPLLALASTALPAHAEATSDAAARNEPPAAHNARQPRGAAPLDPLQGLRDRLAAKLGATKAAEDEGAAVLRVSTQPDGEMRMAPQAAPAQRPSAKPGSGKPAAKAGVRHTGAHWSYHGENGPQAWARLKPEFGACGNGTRQSPIDIRDGIRVDLEPVQFEYQSGAFSVLDNGHTVQVNVAPGNAIEVMGRRFELVQFHFHRPSEERIDGRQFDMVVHLVHRDAAGKLAVVAVLLDSGSAHPVVQAVWNNLPLEKGDPVNARAPLDPAQLLPQDRRYYAYMGSLTTPPCSEGVLWMVMQQPVAISAAQIDVFAHLYPMNARPLQQASGRLIKQSN
ncbi:MAG: carbonic anhydrase family protein [Ideonella sp.]|nr:carbonic anhydrase family protein [Ideonella sp.]MCC7456381.1 carbonic anhydrase family protein [Nitrospira sp.]